MQEMSDRKVMDKQMTENKAMKNEINKVTDRQPMDYKSLSDADPTGQNAMQDAKNRENPLFHRVDTNGHLYFEEHQPLHNKHENGDFQELESLRMEYSNVFDRSNKLDNKVYIIITFCGFLFVFITGLLSSFTNISFAGNRFSNVVTGLYVLMCIAVIVSYVYILIYLMQLLEPEGIKRMDPEKMENLKLGEMSEEAAVPELIHLYRDVVNTNLERLHIRCDKLVVGLRYVVLTVILAFSAYAMQILLRLQL